MATPQTDVQSRTIELSSEAMDTFCEDISSMFGIEMESNQLEASDSTITDLKKNYKKLAAVYSVKSQGILDGSYHLIFDKDGLFTMAGIIVMQPEQKIQENRKAGSSKDADALSDAIGEVGNLLVGSWDRIFREEMEGHGHFVQTSTFIGDPIDNSEQCLGLSKDQQFLFQPFQITVDSYPAFNCGIVFPKDIFNSQTNNDSTQQNVEQDTTEPTEPDNVAQNTEESKPEPPAAVESPEPSQEPPQVDATDEKPDNTTEDSNTDTNTEAKDTDTQEKAEETETIEEVKAQDQPDETSQAQENPTQQAVEAGQTAEVDQTQDKPVETEQVEENKEVAPNEPEKASEPKEPVQETIIPVQSQQKPISETIHKMTKSPAVLPGENSIMSLGIQAAEIMCKDIPWGSPDDSVEQAIAKLQQYDAGYMLIGQQGKIEGIVSKSDLAGATSPYLKPVFAKWRRPVDDASLQIKVKWIMTRPVRTITPETTLKVVMDNMRQFGGRCLPVVDRQGNALGLVTVFDIFKSLLEDNTNSSSLGKTNQAPPLI